jgi:hypothetical protein
MVRCALNATHTVYNSVVDFDREQYCCQHTLLRRCAKLGKTSYVLCRSVHKDTHGASTAWHLKSGQYVRHTWCTMATTTEFPRGTPRGPTPDPEPGTIHEAESHSVLVYNSGLLVPWSLYHRNLHGFRTVTACLGPRIALEIGNAVVRAYTPGASPCEAGVEVSHAHVRPGLQASLPT